MTKLAVQMGVHEAKTQLSHLLRLVAGGQEVEILRDGTPVARLVPARPTRRRRLGTDQGSFQVPDDFDAPLPEHVLDDFLR